jgi:hypothetical protein
MILLVYFEVKLKPLITFLFSAHNTCYLAMDCPSQLFKDQTLNDLWTIDYCIPLKDKQLVKLIRCAVCWIFWFERNNIIFKYSSPSLLELQV